MSDAMRLIRKHALTPALDGILFFYWGRRMQRRVPVRLGQDILLGSGSRVDLRLPGSGVSTLHAYIYSADEERNNKQLYIKDLNSTNGTWVNGKRIADATALHSGDLIQIGYITFLFIDRDTFSG